MFAGLVENRQLFDAVLVQRFDRLFWANAFARADDICRHHFADFTLWVFFKADVAARHNTDQGSVVYDGKAADIVLAHESNDVADCLVGTSGDWVEDHAGLGLLHRLYFPGLFGNGQVLMNDSDTAGLRHDDGRGCFRHCIHSCGH